MSALCVMSASAVMSVMMIALAVVARTFAFDAAAVAFLVAVFMSALCVMSASAVMPVMMIALRSRIVLQRTVRKRLRRGVRGSLHAGIQFDIHLCKRFPSDRSDASADQYVRFCRFQEPGKRAVMDAVGIDDLFLYNLSVFDVVQLELFRLTEVLKDFSVLICDRDSHNIASFHCNCSVDLDRLIFTAAADDQKLFAVNERVGDLFPRAVVDRRDGGAGNAHSGCARLLRQPAAVQQLYRFKLVDGHPDGFRILCVVRRKAAIDRHLSDFSVFDRSRHTNSFLTYVDYYHTTINDICQ